MNYYYDLILNFDENNILFYEWESSDNLENIEKIPIYKIGGNDMFKIYKNHIKVSEDFFVNIKNKTILKNIGVINTINAVILSDTKTSIALEFDKNGKEIARSNLLLEDDLNVCEIAMSMKKKIFKFECVSEVMLSNNIRKIKYMKDYISMEVTKLYQEKDIVKLSFLFLEWFNKNEDNIDVMYKNILSELDKDFDDNQLRIYEIIKLSYSKI